MGSERQQRYGVLVVGGGPAGIAAAVRAAERGTSVGIVDDNTALGGQIWRGGSDETRTPEAATWRQRLRAAGVAELCGIKVFHQPELGVLLAEGAADLRELRYDKLVLATGARERFLPFPGWTLPNVMGAGGLQAMVKCGLPIQGKRVVVAGTGPLLLAVAAYLREHGAAISTICEQASWGALARFSAQLLRYPGKIVQGLQLKKQLAGIRFCANSWPLAAHGRVAVESVTISRSGKQETLACDYLACGFHLVPNTELQQLLGCQIVDGYVQVDDFQRTTVNGIFCAGEPTSIGGVELSLIEGQIAGLTAAGHAADAKRLFGEREKARRFALMLEQQFRLRPELKILPEAATIVCRCEDVPHARLAQHTGWRAAKLHTRCGMGPCQARICGPAAEYLYDWKAESVRPPFFPARVASLSALAAPAEVEPSAVRSDL